MPLSFNVWSAGEGSRPQESRGVSPVPEHSGNGRDPPTFLPRRDPVLRPSSRGSPPAVLRPAARRQEHYEAESELSDTGSTPVMEDPPFYPTTRGPTQMTPHRVSMRPRLLSSRREPTYHIQQGLNNLTLRHMSTPFSDEIMNTPKEPKVKTPTIEAYDGTTDPDMHLVAYRHHMYVQGTNEAT